MDPPDPGVEALFEMDGDGARGEVVQVDGIIERFGKLGIRDLKFIHN